MSFGALNFLRETDYNYIGTKKLELGGSGAPYNNVLLCPYSKKAPKNVLSSFVKSTKEMSLTFTISLSPSCKENMAPR